MSFILDALNRSDNDRNLDPDVPGIQSMHGPAAFESAPLWRRLLWPGIALVFAVMAAATWWSGRESVPPPAEPLASAAPTPETTAPAPQPVKPAVASIPPPARSASQQADIAALYDRAPQASREASTAQVAAETPAPAAKPAPAPAAEPSPPEPAMDVEALAQAAQAELDNLQASREPVVEHSAPFVNELRQSVKDQIPSVFYNAHNWSRDPRKRSVILNKREFREGQRVKPGLKLVEILEDSIVLDFRGTEFRLRSLNSWVNL